MNVKRYYEETRKIIRESDSLYRKPVWTEGDFIQAQVLISMGRERAIDYDVYHKLEMRLAFNLPAGMIITRRY